MARMMEAAGEPTAPALFATPKVESLWATVPGLQYAQHDPEDLDTTQPDHVADSCHYLLIATHDKRYSFQPGDTDSRA